jgi:hypothetical protein
VKKYNKENTIKKTQKMEEEFLTRLINADDDFEDDTWNDDTDDADADDDTDDADADDDTDDTDDVPKEEEAE